MKLDFRNNKTTYVEFKQYMYPLQVLYREQEPESIHEYVFFHERGLRVLSGKLLEEYGLLYVDDCTCIIKDQDKFTNFVFLYSEGIRNITTITDFQKLKLDWFTGTLSIIVSVLNLAMFLSGWVIGLALIDLFL